MRTYSLLLLLLIGCGPVKPKTHVIKCVEYMAIDKVEYVHDTNVVDSLKKENHLLRIEIDQLKEKLAKLEILHKLKKQADKINLK